MPTQKEMDDYNRARTPNLEKMPTWGAGGSTMPGKPGSIRPTPRPTITKPSVPATNLGTAKPMPPKTGVGWPTTPGRIGIDPREINGGLNSDASLKRRLAVNGPPAGSVVKSPGYGAKKPRVKLPGGGNRFNLQDAARKRIASMRKGG